MSDCAGAGTQGDKQKKKKKKLNNVDTADA